MNKDCQPSIPTRRRNHTKKTPGSRTAHLEEKLDDLVSLIRSQSAAKGVNDTAHTIPIPIPNPDTVLGQPHPGSQVVTVPSISSESTANKAVASNPHTSEMWCIDNVAERASPASGGPGSEYDHYIPNDIAEDNVARFRHVSLRFAPIVYLPPPMTSNKLRQTRPLLWLSIMGCTTRSLKEAHAIGNQIRQIISHKVLLASERSLDLLQGLLVFLTWYGPRVLLLVCYQPIPFLPFPDDFRSVQCLPMSFRPGETDHKSQNSPLSPSYEISASPLFGPTEYPNSSPHACGYSFRLLSLHSPLSTLDR